MNSEEKKREEAQKEHAKRPTHFADNFLRKYGEDVKNFPLADVLRVFFVYSGCANQFSVTEEIRKLKRKYAK